MIGSAAGRYVLGFLEGSLGLASGWLQEEIVPQDLVAEVSSVMRGTPPTVSETPSLEIRIKRLLADVERDSLDSRGFFVRKARWPRASPFAVCLTHDVDNIARPMEHILKVQDRFEKEDLEKAKRGLLSLYDNIEHIAKREGDSGFHSSFYFLSSNYPLEQVKPSARRIHKKGWDVGLHGDFGTHDSLAMMRKAMKRFEEGIGLKPRGLREHFLKFDFAKSWRVMEDARFDYDTTVGNNDELGFKLGLAAPFHPPDDKWNPMRLLELPLSLMDTTLWGYLKKTEEEGFDDVGNFIDMVGDVEGLFTLLWHQEAVRMKGGRIYWRILKEIQKRGCFVGSGAEIARWWRAREVPLKVSNDGKLITLLGAPPKGLVIQLKESGDTKAEASSAIVSKGRGSDGLTQEISPIDSSFKLERSMR
ncbi:MAG: hypothetical protein OK455_00590 [Thaumarchaeota archaeon]|nr:hypothetical protein [Nitrososphaerota archaeon]